MLATLKFFAIGFFTTLGAMFALFVCLMIVCARGSYYNKKKKEKEMKDAERLKNLFDEFKKGL